jgi:hypothetical protein
MSEAGVLVYTERAFAQDAHLAMEGKIDRALIELITNADDAYGQSAGVIQVNIQKGDEKFPYEVSVLDSALGLDHEGLKEAFTKIGGKNSKLAHGGESRGLLGRGAKDVAVFGKVHFEALKNGLYSDLTINSDGTWNSEFADTVPTFSQLERLNNPKESKGLLVTIHVASGLNFPKAKGLKDVLKNTAQLRKLYERREVSFSDFRDSSLKGNLISDLPLGDVIYEGPLTIAGYPGESTISIRKLHSRQTGRENDLSAHGLLLQSGQTVFENTWFNLSGRAESYTLAGDVVIPQAMEILKTELEQQFVGQIGLVTRSRVGLTKTHPFYLELQKAVSLVALPIMDKMASENVQGQQQGEKLDKALKVVAETIRQDVKDILKDLDEDFDAAGGGTKGVSEFDVIPPRLVVAPGKNGSFSLRVISELTTYQVGINTSSQAGSLQGITSEIPSTFTASWSEHPLLDRKITQWRFTAGEVTGTYPLTFSLGSSSVTVEVEIREAKVTDPKIPSELCFSPEKYSVSPQRSRNLKLVGPIELSGSKIDIVSAGVDLAEVTKTTLLSPSANGQFAEATIRFTAGLQKGESQITATLNDETSAKAFVNVVEPGLNGGIDFSFRLDGETNPPARWWINASSIGSYECVVYPNHSSFNGVFGPFNQEDSKFSLEDEDAARAVLALTVANAFATYFTELEYSKRPERHLDSIATMARQRETFELLAGKIEKALRP